MEKLHFKVSSGLKDIIGRDLITNELVAIFELVKMVTMQMQQKSV